MQWEIYPLYESVLEKVHSLDVLFEVMASTIGVNTRMDTTTHNLKKSNVTPHKH